MFEHSDKVSVVIGSHNLTHGAFEVNDEVSVLIDFDKADPAIKELLDWIKDASRDMLCVTYSPAWLSEYERLYELAKQKRKEIDDQRKDTSSQADTERREGLPINLTWDDWYTKISGVILPSHDVNRRLVMLDYIGSLFGTYPNYAAMPLEERMKVAGLASQDTVDGNTTDWGYFGNMRMAQRLRPDFRALVLEEPWELSAALDTIPKVGPVNESHWNRYWNAVKRTDNGRGSLGRGLATRLATMRRPDVFISLNDASAKGLSKLLDVPVSSLDDGQHYWERVIQVVQRTPWDVAEEPREIRQVRAWRVRAALLDSLVYEA